MEIKKSRKQQAEETKQHIFSVAARMLDEKEFEDITIRDIVKEAGVSIGAFYNYFPTKMDVYYETYEIADRHFETKVSGMLIQNSAVERIVTFFCEYAAYSSKGTGIKLTKLLYHSGNTYFNRSGDYGMVRILSREIKRGFEIGELTAFGKKTTDDADVREVTEFLMISARGLTYNWCTQNGAYDLREATEKYIRRLLRACTGKQ